MILNAIIVALIAAFCIEFAEDGRFSLSKTLVHYGIAAVFGTVLTYVWLYIDTPAFVGIMGGYYRVAAIPIIVISILLFFISTESDAAKILQGVKIGAVVVIGVFLMLTPAVYSNALHDVPNVTIHNNISNGSNFAPIDPQNMRIIDQSMAYYLGNKVLGSSDQNLGSQFEVKQSDFSIQNVNGRLYWVAPLEFRDIYKWHSAGASPGFVMVDAEDPNKAAKLYTGYNMQYMNSAYFGKYVIRHLYANGYTNFRLEDINFEVTDNLKPKWVVSLTAPTVLNDGDVVEGIAVIDPETGDIEHYPVSGAPAWVDRVMPEETAKNYLDWYGMLVHGYLNAILSQKDVNVISSDEMYLIHGNNGQAYWFAGMTSPSRGDQSLTGIALVNSRTGDVSLYKTSGWNEQAVINNVNAAVSNYKNYHGCQPIPYDCSGRLAYVVPVAANTDIGSSFQEVSIVDAQTGHPVIGETKAKAFEAYRRYLNQNGYDFAVTSSSRLGNVTGLVNRISGIVSSGELGYRLLYLNGSEVIYEVPISQFPEVALTDKGDNVSMAYEDTNDTVITVNRFDNAGIDARISEEQKNYTQVRENQTALETNNWDKQQELQGEIDKLRSGDA